MSEIFVRTKAGLSNAHLFYDADFIVYCESHPDRPEEMSWDLGFWRKILSQFSPLDSYVFKPQGGKSAVIAVADQLMGSSGHKSICLVDRDFSDIHETKHEAPFVVCTYGYAFENDLCDPYVLASAVDSVLPGMTSLVDIRGAVEDDRQCLERQFRWPVVADAILSLYFSSLFDRTGKRYKSICDCRGSTSSAKISRARAMARLQSQKAAIAAVRPVANPNFDVDTWRRMLGHLCWWLNFRMCRNIMARYGFTDQLSEDIFAGVCLNFFSLRLGDSDWSVSKHYAKEIPRAFASAA